MDLQTIKEIAQDRIISDLCIKWYLEENEQNKIIIYDEIIKLYIKINNQK